MNLNTMRELLSPQSIAIVGASNSAGKYGNELLKNIVSAGYDGKIYPINPKDDEVQGIKAYKSLLDVEEQIDMVSICIKADDVPGVIKQAVEKKVKSAIIFSNGFREAGREDLENEISEIIKGSDIRIIGPNVQGIINTSSKLSNINNVIFPNSGNVGIVSQSGSAAAYITEKMHEENIGVSTLINLGNQLDLCESDFIEYLAEDKNTEVIALYLEGPKDGLRFKQVLKEAAKKKPIVLIKPGITDEGTKMAASHTASIAGNDEVFSHACKQYGVIRCKSMTEYIDTVCGLAKINKPKGNRTILISSSGGIGSIATDELIRNGFELATLPEEAIKEIKLKTKKEQGIGSLMDLAESLENFGIVSETLNKKYEDYFDIYFYMIADSYKGIEYVIKNTSINTQKTVIVSYMSETIHKKNAIKHLRDNSTFVYECPDRAAVVLKNMLFYNKSKERNNEEKSIYDD